MHSENIKAFFNIVAKENNPTFYIVGKQKKVHFDILFEFEFHAVLFKTPKANSLKTSYEIPFVTVTCRFFIYIVCS